METNQAPPAIAYLPPALLFALIGWGGLGVLFEFAIPTVGPRWLFFFFGFVALTGTALPFTALFNRRFPTRPPAGTGVITRQAMWVGVWGCILAWLQLSRVLNSSLVLLFAVGFVMIEWMLRMVEISTRKGETRDDG